MHGAMSYPLDRLRRLTSTKARLVPSQAHRPHDDGDSPLHSNDFPTVSVRFCVQPITRFWLPSKLESFSGGLSEDSSGSCASRRVCAQRCSGTGSSDNQRMEQGPGRITEPSEIFTGMVGGAGRVRTAASQFCSLPEGSTTDDDQQGRTEKTN